MKHTGGEKKKKKKKKKKRKERKKERKEKEKKKTLLDRHCVASILSPEKLQSKTGFSQYSNSLCFSSIEIFH